MAVPKKKHTRSRTLKRKNALTERYKLPSVVACSSCKKFILPHMECPYCGHYKTQAK